VSKTARKLFQVHSSSMDSPQHQKQLRDVKRRIIPSLSITLPDGKIQPLDVSPLRATDSPHNYGAR